MWLLCPARTVLLPFVVFCSFCYSFYCYCSPLKPPSSTFYPIWFTPSCFESYIPNESVELHLSPAALSVATFGSLTYATTLSFSGISSRAAFLATLDLMSSPAEAEADSRFDISCILVLVAIRECFVPLLFPGAFIGLFFRWFTDSRLDAVVFFVVDSFDPVVVEDLPDVTYCTGSGAMLTGTAG